MTWIKIDEGNLPEHDQRCFVYCPVAGPGYVTLITFDETETDYWLDYYSHWQPMQFPKPPQQCTSEENDWRYFD